MLQRIRRIQSDHRFLFVYLLTLRLAVLALLLWKLSLRLWGHAGLCVLTLALFELPLLYEQLFHAQVPPLLEGIVAFFALAANVCGEMLELYLLIPCWDDLLHLLWGFLAAVIGYAMIDLLGRRQGLAASLPPLLPAMIALSFTALTGVVWELFEYGMDHLFHTDMQKDLLINQLYSVLLHPEGRNQAVGQIIQSVVVNGQLWPGYIDIGLEDTMRDLLLSLLGALPASALIYLEIRLRGRMGILHRLMPRFQLPPPDSAKKERDKS